jgi:hypothetical protein
MKPRHIFWGLLFITLGLLILLGNLGLIHFNFYGIWKFWPVIFILWGISYMSKNILAKGIIAAISAVILAVAFFSFFNNTFGFFNNNCFFNNDGMNVSFDDNRTELQHFNIPFIPKTKNAELNFDAGAGNFKLEDSTGNLVALSASKINDDYNISSSNENGISTVNIKMKKKTFWLGDKNNYNRTLLKLNTNPIWDMYFNLGAASIYFDFSPYIIKNVKVDMGAAALKIKFGDKCDTTNLNIEAGASSIQLSVPQSSGCEVKLKAPLTSRQLEDFEKIDDNVYRTNNFDSAKKKIFISIKAGISSIKVDRYSTE